MDIKIFLVVILLAIGSTGSVIAPPGYPGVVATGYDPAPQYAFAYDIHDTLTGDQKSQAETRNGDVVQGSYSLVEPDGTIRTVIYTADPVNGFNAIVQRGPLIQSGPFHG